MHFDCLTQWPDDSAGGYSKEWLKSQWGALLRSAPTRSVFQGYSWQEAWWRVFGHPGSGHELRLFLAFEEDSAGTRSLVAVAPMMVTRRRVLGLPERVLGFLGTANYSADYTDFIYPASRPEVLEALIGRIFARRDWTLMDLVHLPSETPTLKGLRLALGARNGARPIPCLESVMYDAPTRILGNPEEDRALLSKKSLKRHFNWFSKNGALEFRRCGSLPEIQGYLDAFFQQHIDRRADAGEASLFQDAREKDFYRALAESLFPEQRLHFSVVLFNGRPAAFHFGFEEDGKFFWYKPSFDPRLKKHSPGEVLLKCLFEDAVGRGLREFDFTVGSEAFKYRFANEIRTVSRLRVYRRAFSHCLARSRDGLSALKRRLKSAPALAAES